jgi:hypothetical protein
MSRGKNLKISGVLKAIQGRGSSRRVEIFTFASTGNLLGVIRNSVIDHSEEQDYEGHGSLGGLGRQAKTIVCPQQPANLNRKGRTA